MRFTTEVPADRFTELPQPGDRLPLIMSRDIIRPVWVINAEADGDIIRLELDAPDVEVWEYGTPIPPSPRHLTRFGATRQATTSQPTPEQRQVGTARLTAADVHRPEGPPLRFTADFPAGLYERAPVPGDKVLLVDEYGLGHAVTIVEATPTGEVVHVVAELRDSAFARWGETVTRGFRSHSFELTNNGQVMTCGTTVTWRAAPDRPPSAES